MFLEQARAAATAVAAAALAPIPRPDAQPAATEAGSESDLSWAQQPRARDGEDYAESSPRGAAGYKAIRESFSSGCFGKRCTAVMQTCVPSCSVADICDVDRSWCVHRNLSDCDW